MYKKILVATDGSKLSQKAVTHALASAVLSDAELVAIKVIPRVQQTYYEGAIPLNDQETKRILATWRHDAETLLSQVVALGKRKGVVVKPVVVSSDLVAETLIKTALKTKADLIVMASHGRRGISRLLLGSETNHVLTHSSIPVLVIR
ncbi:MAG: universal stress protein [Betaproteobacteria bacterium]|jgi:nucleotide-binding universal stress UspA family protein|nr:universal stress protein [Betaproteobacteria bacterium]NBP45839.1 universal stress protein [Betaproteobacteria bacterium]